MGRESAHPDGRSAPSTAEGRERLGLLVAEVRHYIDHVYVDMAHSQQRRSPHRLDHLQSRDFFVSHERFERLREILEYLLQFTRRLPMATDDGAGLQFRQFRDHLIALFALLLEADVAAAAQQAHGPGAAGLPETVRLAERTAHEILALARSARTPHVADWRKLFDAVRRYATFWFEIKGPRYERIRESDVYLYRLADFLLHQLDAAGGGGA